VNHLLIGIVWYGVAGCFILKFETLSENSS